MTTTLTGIIADHIDAVNASDTDRIVATFAPDAMLNDNRREFWGRDAIRAWVAKEIVGDRVTMAVTEVIEHHGETIVRARYDGDYDKTNLPAELVMTSYIRVADGRIVSLKIINTMP